ncbi:MAG TPA: hypothetical protein VEH82_04275 [Acidimicrobiales bacterium]|nr:hypothetical protein [Acidimicrobiales bacterium]
MELAIAAAGMAVLGGLAVVAVWLASGDAECAETARHPRVGAPAYCRLTRGHAGGHRYFVERDHLEF